MHNIVRAPRQKMKRADKHLAELQDRIGEYGNTEFCVISEETDSRTGHKLVCVSVDPVPEEIPLIIGDYVHNVRSALDIVWTRMVSGLGAGAPRWASFPIFETRQELEGSLAAEKIVIPALPAIKNILLDDIQPYETGNGRPIWMLNQLDRTDKHRLLLTTAIVTNIKGVRVIDENKNVTTLESHAYRSGTKSSTPITRLNFKDASYGKESMTILFSVEPAQELPVLPTLLDMGRQVIRAIALVSDAWNASGRG